MRNLRQRAFIVFTFAASLLIVGLAAGAGYMTP